MSMLAQGNFFYREWVGSAPIKTLLRLFSETIYLPTPNTVGARRQKRS